MNIEIQQPKLAALIQARMASGYFQTIEEALVQALEHAPFPAAAESAIDNNIVSSPEPGYGQKLADAFAQIRGLADEVDFGRNRSLMRAVDLA